MAEQWSGEESGCRCLCLPAMFFRMGVHVCQQKSMSSMYLCQISGDIVDEPVSG